MGRLIPNENTWVGFAATIASAALEPTETEVAGATDLTPLLMSLNASSQGNVVPTPSFDTLFETSIIGTSQATFTADFYRDDAADTAWTTLTRGTFGYFIVSRFGGSGTDQIPEAGDVVEVWPVTIVSRTAANMQNNTVMSFTVNCAVNIEPNEAATVTASSGVPGVPRNVTAAREGTGIVVVDFDAPTYVGTGITEYHVYSATTVGGSYTEVTTNITFTGTTARLTSVAGGNKFYKVSAENAAGEGPQSTATSAVDAT